MAIFLKVISKLPIPQRQKLDWQRTLLESSYASDIETARKEKDSKKVEMLISEQRFVMDLHEEDEDKYVTVSLLRQARKLRIPIPHKMNESNTESDHWYQGHHTGGWYLTNKGICSLRKEVRTETRERHEERSKWIAWVTTCTGVIGAMTGLIAVISTLLKNIN